MNIISERVHIVMLSVIGFTMRITNYTLYFSSSRYFDDEWRIQNLKRERETKKNYIYATHSNHMFSQAFDVDWIAILYAQESVKENKKNSVCANQKWREKKKTIYIRLETVRLIIIWIRHISYVCLDLGTWMRLSTITYLLSHPKMQTSLYFKFRTMNKI